MNDWTCPYCRAYNKTGRCVKCGAFFEDKFDDPPVLIKSYEKAVAQKAKINTEMIRKLYGVSSSNRSKKKQKDPVRSKVVPILVCAVILMLAVPFIQSSIVGNNRYNEDDGKWTALIQLNIVVVWSNGSYYNGALDIWDCRGLVERCSILNGHCDSASLYDTGGDLTFTILSQDTKLPLLVHILSFADMQDWPPGIYADYPVSIKLDVNEC